MTELIIYTVVILAVLCIVVPLCKEIKNPENQGEGNQLKEKDVKTSWGVIPEKQYYDEGKAREKNIDYYGAYE